MAKLTQQDIGILASYVERGERSAYWTYLAAKGDPYARLAAQVVRNDTFDGVVANRYAKQVASERGITKTPEAWNKVGVDLIKEDLVERSRLVSEDQGAAALFLGVDLIKQTHESSCMSSPGRLLTRFLNKSGRCFCHSFMA